MFLLHEGQLLALSLKAAKPPQGALEEITIRGARYQIFADSREIVEGVTIFRGRVSGLSPEGLFTCEELRIVPGPKATMLKMSGNALFRKGVFKLSGNRIGVEIVP